MMKIMVTNFLMMVMIMISFSMITEANDEDHDFGNLFNGDHDYGILLDNEI